ncbi:MAG: bifunctional aspartate kinase/homoserine dehydrogenase I, partial [Wenzhouxiangella sp.]
MQSKTHKFGGSSLADAECIAQVAKLLLAREDDSQVVVVSAMAGVTNELIALTRDAASDSHDWRARLTSMEQRHLKAAESLTKGTDQHEPLVDALKARFVNLNQLVSSLALMGTAPTEVVELVSGLGEVYSAALLSATLRARGGEAVFLDARDILRTRPTALMVAVDWPSSAELLAQFRQQHPARRYVVTGFVCRQADGRISTLGRNGSDYSASIFARLFESDEIHIWTNVDGLLSADPAAVPQAILLDHLSYREAFELAYFGARVIHPQTLTPALEAGIPVFIRNTFKPDCPGTRVDAVGNPKPPVKGISGMGDMALINIEGAGMIGVPGTAERVFSALRQADVSVSMISQGSSEHSICLVVPGASSRQACEVLEDAFERELRHGQIQRIACLPDIRVLAIVGDGMAGTPGIAASLFNALTRAGVNVRAIAQGASERNLSVAIDEADADRAIKAIHAGFYLSEQTLSIGLIGPGHVGQALVRQIEDARARLMREARLDLRLRGVASSRRMRLSDLHLTDFNSSHGLADNDETLDLDRFAAFVDDDHLPHAVLIDCTASDAIAANYPDWLARGIHVITPNKHAGSGPISRYRGIRQKLEDTSARWRYEATVGAGLPIIQTLRDLIDTGDRVLRIDGILSGTLAYLFNRYAQDMSFAELVREARQAGYTEPDPRDDLSGTDVARKLVILAREMGLEIELAQVSVESLVPAGTNNQSVDEFLAGLGQMDEA